MSVNIIEEFVEHTREDEWGNCNLESEEDSRVQDELKAGRYRERKRIC